MNDLLLKNRKAILEKWFDRILETYPPDTSRFLKSQKDRFANPVGNAILDGIEAIFNDLMGEFDPEKINPFLDYLMKIRAVQEFSPSKAVSFVFTLKDIVRDLLKSEINKVNLSADLHEFESKIDRLALSVFEIYMKYREKLYELRANELRNRTFKLLERANLIYRIPEEEKEIERNKIDVIP